MAGFLLRRFASHAVLVVLAASLGYLLAAASLDPRANFEGRSPRPPARVVDATLTEFNLNDRTPLPQRYAIWASGVLRGDFGRTWEGGGVGEELGRRAAVSVRLLVSGAVLGCLGGVLLGAYAAIRQYGLSDRLITLGSFLILSVPVFVLAVLLQTVAQRINDATGMTVFAWTGEFDPAAGPGIGGRIQHLVLPTLTIALGQIAIYSRYQRSVMLDVLNADYVRTAMARGLRRRTALLKHGLRTALIPVTTHFGYTFGFLMIGGMFTEKIFGWHGVGEWLVDAINGQDLYIVVTVTTFAGLVILVSGLLSDIVYAMLDPRVRIS